MGDDAKQKLLAYKEKLDPGIDAFFKDYVKSAPELSEDAKVALDVIRDFTSRGGKRLRGALTYYGYLLLNGSGTKDIVHASICMEILHSYILMLDDVMDKSDIRHNGPTAHIFYRDYHRSHFVKGDPDHFGVSMGLMTSLVASHLAQLSLARMKFPAERIRMALDVINDRLMYTGFGQVHDVLSEVKPDFTSEEEMLVLRWKTSTYTYEMPLHVGAVLAGGTKSDLKKISTYAIPAGIAFQLQDDLLGMYGSEERLGKPVGTDITEGKQTILVLTSREKGSPAQKKRLNALLGKDNLTPAELDDVRSIFEETGAFAYTKKLAERYVKKALNALDAMSMYNKEAVDFLRGIAEYMINRDI